MSIEASLKGKRELLTMMQDGLSHLMFLRASHYFHDLERFIEKEGLPVSIEDEKRGALVAFGEVDEIYKEASTKVLKAYEDDLRDKCLRQDIVLEINFARRS